MFSRPGWKIGVAKIHQLLKKDYTFKSSRTVALDRRKEPWPANIAEADVLWKDRIEGELLQEKLNKFAVDPGPKVVGSKIRSAPQKRRRAG